MSGFKPKISRRWQVLRQRQVQSLHDATLKLLSEEGVVFQSEAALEVLRKNGVRIEGKIARFPAALIEKAIENCPSEVILRARNPERNVVLGHGNIHYTNCFGPVRVRRLGMTETVPATREDLRHFTVLSDALENVAYCLFHVRPCENPVDFNDIYSAATMLKITDKHIHFSQDSAASTDVLITLGEVAVNDAPNAEGPVFSLGGCSTSPLIYSEDVCTKFIKAVPRGIPFLVVSGAISGGTAPATLAGTLLVQNAEVLAGVALAQLLRPGAPLIYGAFSGGMDMRSGNFVMGGTELALMQAATAQLCDLYHIPFGYGSGGWTDARDPNVQAGFEKGCTLLAAALAGVEVVHSAIGGMLGGAEIADYAQMIIDDELCSMVNRYLQGISFDARSLAYDVIREVGPGGNFLGNLHTAQSFRNEHFLPQILERVTGETKIEGIIASASERAQKILDSHKPNYLSRSAAEKMDELVDLAVRSQE